MLRFMKPFFLLIFLITLTTQSCDGSDDSNIDIAESNLQATCFQDENRDVVEVFTDVLGFVIHPKINDCSFFDENTLYLLGGFPKTPELYLELFACNLEDQFKTDRDSLQVTYSGYVFETFDNEDICARLFEITEIRLNQNQ